MLDTVKFLISSHHIHTDRQPSNSEQILKGLRYFCVSCALGIGAIYFLMITWFLAWMTIDQRRLEDKRNAFAPCIKYEDWKPSDRSQKGYMKIMLNWLGRLLEFRIAQVRLETCSTRLPRSRQESSLS